jgi:hypothetical protein
VIQNTAFVLAPPSRSSNKTSRPTSARSMLSGSTQGRPRFTSAYWPWAWARATK